MYTEEKYNDIDKLIASYLSNELDEKSFSELKRWSMESETNRIYVRDQLEIWFSSGVLSDKTFFNKNEAFDLFKQRVAEAGRNKRLRRFSWKVIYRVAAVVLLLLLPLATYWQGKEVVKHNFADMVVEAPLGARTKLYLPDGTLVWLNAGSKIVYSQGFGVDDRNLSLEGEGYFEVKRNEEVPFLVKTNSLLVKVLGTKFNFRDYPDDAEAIVSLSEGKVALNNLLKKEKEAFLLPNERVVLNKKNGRMHVEYSTVSNALQWTNGYLFFDEELLPDVVKELERSYNVKIQIASDTLNTFRFYGNFVHREQNIQEVLEALSATRKIHYIIEGHNITLY